MRERYGFERGQGPQMLPANVIYISLVRMCIGGVPPRLTKFFSPLGAIAPM